MPVSPVPEGFHTVTPYLVTRDVPRLVEFLAAAFDAVELHRATAEGGRVMNSIVRVGDSMVMMSDETPEYPAVVASLYLYVPDVDATWRQAVAAGGISIMEPADQFYGDRNAGVLDLSGNRWWIATHVEDVSPEELERRVKGRKQPS